MFHSIPVLARAIAGALLLAASAALAQAPAPVPTGASSAAEPAPTPGDAREGTFKTVQGEVTLVRGAPRSAARRTSTAGRVATRAEARRYPAP